MATAQVYHHGRSGRKGDRTSQSTQLPQYTNPVRCTSTARYTTVRYSSAVHNGAVHKHSALHNGAVTRVLYQFVGARTTPPSRGIVAHSLKLSCSS
eukprot:13316092-Heterocapsa_arctica.AAC.1